MERELISFLTLYLAAGMGPRRVLGLFEYFGSAEKVLGASAGELMRVPGIGSKVVTQFLESLPEATLTAEAQLKKLPSDTMIVPIYSEQYPALLKTIYSPPLVLFVRGNVDLLNRTKKIAVVGSRKTTDYGRWAAKEFSEAFAAENVVVVSGFARGIDTAAHVASFEAGGETIAVLGSGTDIIYPSVNKQLAEDIVASGRGVVVSELPLGTKPEGRNFPWRNRIVSGLSQAVIIVESEVQGGSMITASLALDQNRDIFAIPGDIRRPFSSGPNELIRESRAKLAQSARQIMEELGWIKGSAQKNSMSAGVSRAGLTLFENKIVDVLEDAAGPLQIDLLSERAEMETQEMLVHLLALEFRGTVRQLAGKQFSLVQ